MPKIKTLLPGTRSETPTRDKLCDFVREYILFDNITKMSGVGDVLAPRLIAEIGDVRRFHNGSALVAFAGLDSPPYESGNFVGTKGKYLSEVLHFYEKPVMK